MLVIVKKLLKTKRLLTSPSNVLPLNLKQTFPPMIWIFTEGEGDGIKSRLPFKIFSTLLTELKNKPLEKITGSKIIWPHYAMGEITCQTNKPKPWATPYTDDRKSEVMVRFIRNLAVKMRNLHDNHNKSCTCVIFVCLLV